jgi:hypothetical protein
MLSLSNPSRDFYPNYDSYTSLMPIRTRGERMSRICEYLEANKSEANKSIYADIVKEVLLAPQTQLSSDDEFEKCLLNQFEKALKRRKIGQESVDSAKKVLKEAIQKVEFFMLELSPLKPELISLSREEKLTKIFNALKKLDNPQQAQRSSKGKEIEQETKEFKGKEGESRIVIQSVLDDLLRSPIIYLCPDKLLLKIVFSELQRILRASGASLNVTEEERIRLAFAKVEKTFESVKKSPEKMKTALRGEWIDFCLKEIDEKKRAQDASSQYLVALENALLRQQVVLCSDKMFIKRAIECFKKELEEDNIICSVGLSEAAEKILKIAQSRLFINRLIAYSDKAIIQPLKEMEEILDLSSLTAIEDTVIQGIKNQGVHTYYDEKKLKEAIHSAYAELKFFRAPPSAKEKARLEELYAKGEPIPAQIESFDPLQKHTLEVDKYVDARISRTIIRSVEVAKTSSIEGERGVEIFLGPLDDLKAFYASKGFHQVMRLGTDSSNSFYLLRHEADSNRIKVVVHRVINKSRLSQVLLQLKSSGIKLNDIAIRGTIAGAKAKLKTALETQFKKLKPHSVIIGSRMHVLKQIAMRLFPDEMLKAPESARGKLAEKLLSNYEHKVLSIDQVITFSYVNIPSEKGKVGICILRMPNGDLAYDATQAAIKAGAKDVIMVGAGGSFYREVGDVGAYQQFTKSIYEDKVLDLNEKSIMHLDVKDIDLVKGGANITVDTPLQETISWYDAVRENKEITNVDVESYHILKASQEAPDVVRILPGIFISDVVNDTPLNEKIDDVKTLKSLPQLVSAYLDLLGIEKGQSKDSASVVETRLEALCSDYEKAVGVKEIDNAFNGKSVEERMKGAETLHALKKEFATKLFEELAAKHKLANIDKRSMIMGFNRLFTRAVSSAGSDIDFMLLIDKPGHVLTEMRNFIALDIKPRLSRIGIEIEAVDYLMEEKGEFVKNLAKIRSALFAMANAPLENRAFLAGSDILFDEIFRLDDEQMARHFATLMIKNQPSQFIDAANCMNRDMIVAAHAILRRQVSEKLSAVGEEFRKPLKQWLHRMANLELYIGKKPYKGKETIHTIFGRQSLKKDSQERVEPFSIKFCCNRFTDMYYNACLSDMEGIEALREQAPMLKKHNIETLEKLATILSNIVCGQNKTENTALHVHENYSQITFEQIVAMTPDDRRIVKEMMQDLGFNLPDVTSLDFAEAFYDSLWMLGDRLLLNAESTEKAIYKKASDLLKDQKKQDLFVQ